MVLCFRLSIVLIVHMVFMVSSFLYIYILLLHVLMLWYIVCIYVAVHICVFKHVCMRAYKLLTGIQGLEWMGLLALGPKVRFYLL